MKIHLDSPPEEAQIQIIPLMDVIFCILTFFILAALQFTRQQGIELNLPRAHTGTTPAREMLVVTLTSNGFVLVNQNPQLFDRLQLRQLVQEYRRQQPEGLLVLNASRNALYDEVIQVLDLLRELGGDRVALATLPAEANQTEQSIPSLKLPGGVQTPGDEPGNTYPIPLMPEPGRSPQLAPRPSPEGLLKSLPPEISPSKTEE